MEEKSLLLKWGTIKGWSGLNDREVEILNRYFKDGIPLGCANDRPNESRKEILCELIDVFEGEIWNDWDGKIMNKIEAKKYVVNYDS